MEPKRKRSILDNRWLPGLLLLAAPLLMGKFQNGPSCDCGDIIPVYNSAWYLHADSEPVELPMADGVETRRFRAVVRLGRHPAQVDADRFTLEAEVVRPKLLAACEACNRCTQCGDSGFECACDIRETYEALVSFSGQPVEPRAAMCTRQYTYQDPGKTCAPSMINCSCGAQEWEYSLEPAALDPVCDADGCQFELELALTALDPDGQGYSAFWNANDQIQAYTPEDAGPASLVFYATVAGPVVKICDKCEKPPAPEDYEISVETVPLQ